MTTGNKTLVLEKLLLMLYSIDVKLNDIFKCTASSFTNASTLFKGIFASLHTHCANTVQITAAHGTSTVNLSSVKESMRIIAEKLQLHDLIEQRLKHIRQINTEIIKEIIETRKSGANHTSEDHVKLIAEINAAQLGCVKDEYNNYCLKLDSGLNAIVTYLNDWTSLTSKLNNDKQSEITLLINRNSDLSDKVQTAIAAFKADLGYRKCFSVAVSELNKSFNTISAMIKVTNRVSSLHPRLVQLQNMYTTQSEREVFNSLVHPGMKNNLSLAKNSDVDIF